MLNLKLALLCKLSHHMAARTRTKVARAVQTAELGNYKGSELELLHGFCQFHRLRLEGVCQR
ncbi:hypothetical protein H5410_010979 [Solanum commersonii]|uniref:Uncharacterized protein n=1 Tax=Solanum commersonii TaxID=4109 RepID=A0A9J6AN21_SOLCO|nr:hypothetical protein H5410_010979 [Solanum commersonii]